MYVDGADVVIWLAEEIRGVFQKRRGRGDGGTRKRSMNKIVSY